MLILPLLLLIYSQSMAVPWVSYHYIGLGSGLVWAGNEMRWEHQVFYDWFSASCTQYKPHRGLALGVSYTNRSYAYQDLFFRYTGLLPLGTNVYLDRHSRMVINIPASLRFSAYQRTGENPEQGVCLQPELGIMLYEHLYQPNFGIRLTGYAGYSMLMPFRGHLYMQPSFGLGLAVGIDRHFYKRRK